MKKLLLIIGTLFCLTTQAAQTVPIIWAFSPASNQAAALRTIIDNANKSQDKYNFVFENKTGAGGSIGVNHVINQNTPTLIMISTTVFTRAKYYPDESYNIDSLKPVAITSTGSPMALLSKSIDVDDLNNRRSITVGMVNGSITETVANTLHKKYGNLLMVPYAGSVDATRDAMGGHIDASVEFIKDCMPWVDSGTARIVGLTGTKDFGNHKTFHSMGINGFENLVANYYMLANKNMNEKMLLEFNEIITKAMTEQNVIDVWKGDMATVNKRSYKETVQFWNTQKDYWKK